MIVDVFPDQWDWKDWWREVFPDYDQVYTLDR